MKINKSNIKFFTSVMILISVVGIGFYWFQVRPANIRRTCDQTASFNAANEYIKDTGEIPEYDENYTVKSAPFRKQDYEVYYEKCLHKYGLE